MPRAGRCLIGFSGFVPWFLKPFIVRRVHAEDGLWSTQQSMLLGFFGRFYLKSRLHDTILKLFFGQTNFNLLLIWPTSSGPSRYVKLFFGSKMRQFVRKWRRILLRTSLLNSNKHVSNHQIACVLLGQMRPVISVRKPSLHRAKGRSLR